jgi:hypothetical protein
MFKFNRIRPKQIKVESEARAKNARAIQVGRHEGILSPNEARAWYGLDLIDEDWAKDAQHPSPVIQAKQQPGGEAPPTKSVEEEVIMKEAVGKNWPYDTDDVKKK